MTDIQPNAQGKVQQARKQLRKLLRQLKNVEQLTALQRNQLFARTLIALTRIKIAELGDLRDDD